jgi:histidine triad (HIT) family protein
LKLQQGLSDMTIQAADYDASNIFARVLRGELPCHRVYEDADTLAFLDIMPQCEGHTLVIPKAPSRGLDDANPDTVARLIRVVWALAPRIRDTVGGDGFRVVQFNGASAGQTVFHLHFHILPTRPGVVPGAHAAQAADAGQLAALAERLRQVLA